MHPHPRAFHRESRRPYHRRGGGLVIIADFASRDSLWSTTCQVLLNLMHGHFDKILVQFGAHRTLQQLGIGWTDHSKSAWRSDDNHRLGFAGRNGTIETPGQMYEKDSLRLIVPVRLFDGAACVADGVDGTPRHVCAESVCRQILLFKNFHGLQIGRIDIAYVFQNQGLGAIADHHPLAVSYQKRGHLWSPQIDANLKTARFATSPLSIRQDPISLLISGFSVRAVEQAARNNLGLDLGGS